MLGTNWSYPYYKGFLISEATQNYQKRLECMKKFPSYIEFLIREVLLYKIPPTPL